MNGFRKVVNFCYLFYLGYAGNWFTWQSCRNSGNWVRERLDCALANKNWKFNFHNAKVHHIKSSSSDHTRIFFELEIECYFFGAKPFKFENSWTKEWDIKQVVQMAWEKGRDLPIDEMIKRCGE
ncbi:hypothetical protein R3W88_014623 [Solanum pinnatisectum]|uniref:Uncharacterized protein n=1 Tax=Solanum pinnatisectum TaxID=50273 RepID=A0AAV9KVB1_9SOLN|nr:hypothetical protein R3W88_014623 [Solanum pinnatisectum]